jgi:hypothetical protein
MSDTNAIEDAIYTHLIDDSGISAMISDRVYGAKLPERATMPAIMFRRISGSREVVHNPDTSGSYCMSRFEFNVYGGTYADAVNLGRLVSSLFDGFRGTMGTDTRTHEVDQIEIGQPRDNWDDDLKRHRRQFDAIFHHRET